VYRYTLYGLGPRGKGHSASCLACSVIFSRAPPGNMADVEELRAALLAQRQAAGDALARLDACVAAAAAAPVVLELGGEELGGEEAEEGMPTPPPVTATPTATASVVGRGLHGSR